MTTYNVEENIDFFQELTKSLSLSLEEIKDEEFAINTSLCLITDQILTENFVTMLCGHKFNYVPLYKYLVNYKLKFNSMEISKQRLEMNEIRCPYCRNKQNELLPYYDNIPGIKKVNGINNEYIKMEFNKDHPCCYPISLKPDGSSILCHKYYTSQVQDKYKEKNSQYYCNTHITKVLRQIYKEEKEDCKKQKLVEKQKMKEEKIKMKQLEKLGKKIKLDITSSSLEDNIILENNDLNTNHCCSIVKYGFNKGNHCSFKIFQNGLCKRHYNQLTLKNKG